MPCGVSIPLVPHRGGHRRACIGLLFREICSPDRFFTPIRPSGVKFRRRAPITIETGRSSFPLRATVRTVVMSSDRQQRFTEQFVRCDRRLFGFVITMLPNFDEAEEAYQETCSAHLGEMGRL